MYIHLYLGGKDRAGLYGKRSEFRKLHVYWLSLTLSSGIPSDSAQAQTDTYASMHESLSYGT